MIGARDLLTLARRLANGTAETEWRTAVGRAYFAAFHVARQLLEDLGFNVPPDESAHRYLSLRLSNCGNPQVMQAGSDLERLRRERNFADYLIQQTLRRSSTYTLIRAAEQVIQTLDAARQEPTRTQITDAIKVYEKSVLGVVTWHP